MINPTVCGFVTACTRDMVSWKMIGFPGARYDYREYIGLHNQKLNLVPLSIIGSSAWTKKG